MNALRARYDTAVARGTATSAHQVWRSVVDFTVPFTPTEQPQRTHRSCNCLIRSYLGTARNHGIHPLDALTRNPWMPATNGLIHHGPERMRLIVSFSPPARHGSR
ncbi:hypothetical protein ACBJ59_00815 [Nonomuraea sp. MTCD27]|uniref:hypothetical protein n=1 Tax=Nonomuraea sp. MTCD27 TaxID=1676747 RepID=UPI0035BEDAC1